MVILGTKREERYSFSTPTVYWGGGKAVGKALSEHIRVQRGIGSKTMLTIIQGEP